MLPYHISDINNFNRKKTADEIFYWLTNIRLFNKQITKIMAHGLYKCCVQGNR